MVKEPKISVGVSKGRRTLDRLGGFDTSIGPNNTLMGGLAGPGHCIVLGKVIGDSVLDGTLVIGEGAHWQGNIEAENLVIAGRVTGNMSARRKIEIVSTAEIQGNLSGPFIAIAEGAIYEGDINMAQVKHFADQRGGE